MNIKSYIESGILESYLMGELTEQEMVQVDQVAARHPEVKAELERLRNIISEYAVRQGQTPDKNILTKALAEIDVQEEKEAERRLKVTDQMLEQSMKSSTMQWWKVAAAVLLLISAGLNIYFYTAWKNSQDEVIALSEQNGFLANEVNARNVELENQGQQLNYANLRIAHFLSEDNIHVRMDGSDISPESYANVFWNKKTNSVFISVDNLPEPPHGHQYQLWAIKEGQAPIDAGIFDHSQLVQELKVIRGDVAAFAVTLEKEGGVENASVDQTYVKGFLKKT